MSSLHCKTQGFFLKGHCGASFCDSSYKCKKTLIFLSFSLSVPEAGRCNRKLLKGSFNSKAYHLLGIIMKWVNNNNYSNHNSNSNNHHLLSPYYVSGTVGNAWCVLTHSSPSLLTRSCSPLFGSSSTQQYASTVFPHPCLKYLNQSHAPKPPTNSQKSSEA